MSLHLEISMSKPELRFDPEQHRYWLGDMELPSVTKIMQRLGLVNYQAPWYTEEARQWGIILHACCQLVDEDDLNWDTVANEVYLEVVAYYNWKQRSGFICKNTEKPRASLSYYYAGTDDADGELDGMPCVIDRKRGIANKATRWQLSGYAQLLAEETGIPAKSIRRLALDNMNRGKIHLIEYDNNQSDLRHWLYLVAVHNKAMIDGLFKNE